MTVATGEPGSSWVRGVDGSVHVLIRAQPGAKRSALLGEHGDRLKVAVHAPPVDGKANEELLAWLAQVLQVTKNRLALVHGATARDKVVLVQAPLADVVAKLSALLVSAGQK
ncbi:MAG: DUF167 domain-containing protein [Myxococcales bacterium]|nr:DUF167 domain-containing protein [Myxococcales bacterium]